MLDTTDFFTRIFSNLDEIIICGLRPGGIFFNDSTHNSVATAAARALELDAEPYTSVYFSIGSFANAVQIENGKPKVRRTSDLATWFKTLALDLDIGEKKPYATQKEGWQALNGALKAIGMPTPMVISSGNGLHCYWPMTVAIKRDDWVRISKALRLALEDHGVQIDTTKIHDATMVLRPVGTHHKKQDPWKQVHAVIDCDDHDPKVLAGILQRWVDQVQVAKAQIARSAKGVSSIATAVTQTNDVDLDKVANQCAQVHGLVYTGGVEDIAGNLVEEPMWRVSLGLAKYAIDVKEAVIKIAGKHPDFDLDANMAKMNAWKGSGPPTCDAFENLCPSGCIGCPHKSKVKTPASLTHFQAVVAEPDPVTGEATKREMPPGYEQRENGSIWKIGASKTEEDVDEQGNAIEKSGKEDDKLVLDRPIHVINEFYDNASKKASFRMIVKQPDGRWEEGDHSVDVLSTLGKDFSSFVLNRKIYTAKHAGAQELLRGYLMDYLTLVQKMAPTGQDFSAFGWQEDGSFLCGERVLNSPTGNTQRRLKKPADRFADIIKPHGDRDKWIEAMRMLNRPGSQTIRSAVLLATAGILGPVAGNASMVVSIYSTETTTGKSLALIAANSLIGSPKELFMNKNDTANALFKVRGILNNLPCTIDELTSAGDHDVVNLAYDLSQGREKLAMSKDRDIREPVKWDGPTLITTNISLHQKFEYAQANNDPLKARTLELPHHDRTFIKTDATGSSNGYEFFDLVAENNGWAFPELVEAVCNLGGAKDVWAKGEKAFFKKFNFTFEPQERFYRTGIIAGWIIGTIGKQLGLFPFDVNDTIEYLLDHVVKFRKETLNNRQDVFDVIGQFLQEHNDRIIEVSEVYGSKKEQVRMPAPERAVARLKLVYDTNTPVMPGSMLAINLGTFKAWLQRVRDSSDRICRELEQNGALIAERERVTMFKGCANRNPGQAHCILVNLNHPRFIDALTGTSARVQSPVALAILQGDQA